MIPVLLVFFYSFFSIRWPFCYILSQTRYSFFIWRLQHSLILLRVQFIRFLTILFYLLTFCTLFRILSRLKIYWKLKPVTLDNTQGNLRRVFYRSPFYIKNVTKLKVWQCRYEKHDPCLIECLALYTFAVD